MIKKRSTGWSELNVLGLSETIDRKQETFTATALVLLACFPQRDAPAPSIRRCVTKYA